ncbi:MAG: alanine racemase [Nocardioidaceae bacterium]
MPLTLYVDGERWRAHLRSVADSRPGLVPVAKGNGYGLGLSRLARKSDWLGADLLAVGTYEEIPAVAQRFHGDLLVLTPWRPWVTPGPHEDRVVHTVGRLEDLRALADRGDRARVVLEFLTSMGRHGLSAHDVKPALPYLDRLRLEGIALHLPMARANSDETERWVDVHREARLPATQLFVSHLTPAEETAAQERHGELKVRPRVGTALWLGDRAALHPRTTVLDVHAVSRGDRVGYRQRRIPRDGSLLVVAGGTAHGIALESPAANTSARQRAIALARGGLDAAGFALSPFTIDGKQRWFAEPPHMQASLLFLPASAQTPVVGDEIDVDVRFTTTTFDRVLIS